MMQAHWNLLAAIVEMDEVCLDPMKRVLANGKAGRISEVSIRPFLQVI